MNDATHKAFKWIVTLIALGALAIVGTVLVGVEISRRQFLEYRQALEARGELFEIEMLSPAEHRSEAAEKLLNLAGEIQGLAKPLGSASLSSLATSPSLPNHLAPAPPISRGESKDWEELEQIWEPIFPQVAEAVAVDGDLTMHPRYADGFMMQIPHASDLLNLSHITRLSLVFDLRRGDIASAVVKVPALLRWAEVLANQPTLITQLCGAAILWTASQCTWEILATREASASELEALARAWANAPGGGGFSSALRVERACFLGISTLSAGDIFSLSSGSSAAPSTPSPKSLVTAASNALPELTLRIFRHADSLAYTKLLQQLIDAQPDLAQGQGWSQALDVAREVEAEVVSLPPYFILTRLSLPTLLGTSERFASMEISVALTRTAIAIERYRLAHGGQLPPSLDDLVPDFLDAVPSDPIDAAPLRYRPAADGTFLLYSVGLDGVDNGGDASPGPKRARTFIDLTDAVWPMPSLPEEP